MESRARKVLLVLDISSQFSRELLGRRSGPVQVVVDGRNSKTAAILLSYVNTINRTALHSPRYRPLT